MPSPTVVLLPMWAPGHFSSMLEACKRLLQCSRRSAGGGTEAFSLTVLVMPPPMDSITTALTSSEASSSQLTSGDDVGIIFHHLPAVEHPTDRSVYPSDYIRLFAPHVKEAIAGLAAPVAAVVFDFFATTLLDVVHDLALPAYVYFTSTGATLAFMLRSPAIYDKEFAARLQEKQGTVDLPGMPPVPVTSMPSPEQNDYAWFVYYGRRFMEARGIIVNTATELEPGVLASLAVPGGDRGGAPPVYPIGPVLSQKPPRSGSATDRSPAPPPHECVRWLDGQRPASVVFLCFGSMGWMDARQAREVATGLERSGHSFLWVLRGPPPAAGASLYPTPTDADLGDLLPDGFLERTKWTGLVWPSWAPQSEILAHASVGGFVTHCGWNSVLESLWHGVPMAPWPMYAEQPLNAFELVACMGVAVELGVRDSFFVEAAELERAVRGLMGGSEEGRKAREKAMAMMAACRKAVEEGGSSYAAVQEVVQDILRSYGSSRDGDSTE
ncbi:hypothetical protein U9M48_015298 [Paspalum notatum var. saurae]|uniref:Glycosyltransferase n=1 Tax=Paspalum notatum var. saurae TaxID=547442 RepID=A0AAQ3T4Z0_PASNO